MRHAFLTDEWLDAVQSVQADLPDPPPALAATTINLKIVDGPAGDHELRLDGGRFQRGLAENAKATITVPFGAAKAMFVDQDQAAAMQAFTAGKITIDGDMTALMALQGQGPSAEQREAAEKIKALTADVPSADSDDMPAVPEIPDTTLPRDQMTESLATRIEELGLEKNCRELEEQGYTVIENVADLELTERMRQFAIEHGGKQMLLREDPMFCEAVLNPKLLAMVEYSVGEAAMISQVTQSVRPQGAPALPLHADQNWMPAPFPDHNYLITFCWVHDTFTKEEGATKVVPRTHLKRRHPTREETAAEDGAIAIEAPFNSVALWDGSVWHGNWPREAPGERVVTHITYSRLALRPVEDYSAHADTLIDTHGETMARLLGRHDFLQSPNGADYTKIPFTFSAAKT